MADSGGPGPDGSPGSDGGAGGPAGPSAGSAGAGDAGGGEQRRSGSGFATFNNAKRAKDLQARIDAAGEKARLETRAIFDNLNTIEQVITKPRLAREKAAVDAKTALAAAEAKVNALPLRTTESVLEAAAMATKGATALVEDDPDLLLTTEAGAIARLIKQIQSS